MALEIGDKVVCIDDKNKVSLGIKEGEEYTVKYVGALFTTVFINVDDNPNYLDPDRFRKLEKQRFTNKLTEKLAKLAQEKQHDLIQLPKKKEVLS